MQTQLSFADYGGFVEKFKPKKTTDDCYTPENVYEAVHDWACAEWGIDPGSIVRPFYPGGGRAGGGPQVAAQRPRAGDSRDARA